LRILFGNRTLMKKAHLRVSIAALTCMAAAIGLACWLYPTKAHPDQKKVTSAQDMVYEAVVRDLVKPGDGKASVSQLVFGDSVLTGVGLAEDGKSCEQIVREQLQLDPNQQTPQFNSLADRTYRLVNGGSHDGPLRADTIRDFVAKSCAPGRLFESFHTDLPRTFIKSGSANCRGWPIEEHGSKTFENLFPGAGGLISLSRVGFDSSLDEALVSTSFVCGGLCGSGDLYILRKKRGTWQVVSKRMIWVS